MQNFPAFLPDVVTKAPVIVQTSFPNDHPLYNNARTSIEAPNIASRRSTAAKLAKIRL